MNSGDERTSSSRSNELNEGDGVCPRCHMQGARKVSHSSQNPRREYIKCLRCDKFLKWVENDMERRIIMMLAEIKNKLSELRMMGKLIEKGQSTMYMLLVGVICST